MEIRTYDTGDGWTVEFTHGVQTFALDYSGDDETSATWMAEQLKDCFESAFGKSDSEDLSKLTLPVVSNNKVAVCDICENDKGLETYTLCHRCWDVANHH